MRVQCPEMPRSEWWSRTGAVGSAVRPWVALVLVGATLFARVGCQEVTVSSGRLLGVRVQGAGGARDYLAFRGVPFGAPPVGELRFKAPKPAPSWDGIRNASVEGDMCPQVKDSQVRGSEDCLNVNVYTPSLSCPTGGYAVIVFFYGGSLVEGSNRRAPDFGPDFLVHHDVVLILPNYRVNAFGFLNLNTPGIPGNAGLKDGLLALRWVRDNARAFCGDPERVTIMGQSAGAKMVAFLGLAEGGRGLFRAAIQLSGGANGGMAYTEHNVERAGALAARLTGNDTLDAAGVERTLLQAPFEAIARETFDMYHNSGWGLNYNPFVFSPELRPDDGEPKVLTRDPESLLRDPPVPRVATLTGVCSREGLGTTNPIERIPEKLSLLAENLSELLRAEFVYVGKDTARAHGVAPTPSHDLVQEITARVRQRYFQGRDPSTDYPEMLADMLGDVRYVYPLYRWVRTLDKQKAPMYLYLFDFVDKYSYWKLKLKTNVTGAVHADDLGYLFRVTEIELHQNISEDSPAARALREHVKLVTDFAKTLSSPLLEGRDVAADVDPSRRQRPPYLHFGHDFTMTRVENTLGAEDRMPFWDQIVELMLQPQTQSSGAAGRALSLGLVALLGLGPLLAVMLASGQRP